jgi:hypothetical protein
LSALVLFAEAFFFAVEDFDDDFFAAGCSLVPFEELDESALSSLPGASDARSVLDAGESTPVRSVRLLSVTYQPEPLNRIGGAFNRRRAGLPHTSHGCCAGAPNDSRFS